MQHANKSNPANAKKTAYDYKAYAVHHLVAELSTLLAQACRTMDMLVAIEPESLLGVNPPQTYAQDIHAKLRPLYLQSETLFDLVNKREEIDLERYIRRQFRGSEPHAIEHINYKTRELFREAMHRESHFGFPIFLNGPEMEMARPAQTPEEKSAAKCIATAVLDKMHAERTEAKASVVAEVFDRR